MVISDINSRAPRGTQAQLLQVGIEPASTRERLNPCRTVISGTIQWHTQGGEAASYCPRI